jgi:glucose-1-phosphate adenylyltransferase
MDLVSADPIFSLYNDSWPIYTQMQTNAPAKIVAVAEHGAGEIADSVLSNGVILSGAYVRRTVASPGVRVEPGAVVDGAILMDNVRVGAGAVLRNVIIDKNVVVPPGTKIGVDPEKDPERFTISDGGVVAVPKGHVIG